MDPFFTRAYAQRIRALRDAEAELSVTLAKFAAGARIAPGGEEVR